LGNEKVLTAGKPLGGGGSIGPIRGPNSKKHRMDNVSFEKRKPTTQADKGHPSGKELWDSRHAGLISRAVPGTTTAISGMSSISG